MTYIGNAFYSWQNVFRTLEVFKLIKSKLVENSFLILLIKKNDHFIVNEFLHQLCIDSQWYLLKEVSHSEILNYLNASDMGVALRHNHKMNKIASSGKVLDYLACGLPVLTTFWNGEDLPRLINNKKYGVVLKDMDDNQEVLHKIKEFVVFKTEKRAEISIWANENLSMEAFIEDYLLRLETL